MYPKAPVNLKASRVRFRCYNPVETFWGRRALGSQIRVIAIDGPVAAGKTVVGLKLAERLGFQFLDTGVMYRAITWLALQQAVPMDDSHLLGELARLSPIDLKGHNGSQVVVSGREVSRELRDPDVERHVSLVAQVPQVRQALVMQQRRLAAAGKLVMVGRDIGTVVLPDAGLKVFMSASSEERARRRWQEMRQRGRDVEYQQVLKEIKERDYLDSHRSASPLVPARDARLLETEGLTEEQVVVLILGMIQEVCRGDG
ncbi:MAG: (d)CMP kinase [Dehalococcoidia bacterium]|nr:(d)CMP kinase [Dehalococcoidia bacterium]MSQ17149.1 (d)CMP kinase [Dehalococcoidia bacterium]